MTDSQAAAFFHHAFKCPIKASIGPLAPSLGESGGCERPCKDEQGGKGSAGASWIRICWVHWLQETSFHSTAQYRGSGWRVSVQECSNSPRGHHPLSISFIIVWFFLDVERDSFPGWEPLLQRKIISNPWHKRPYLALSSVNQSTPCLMSFLFLRHMGG